jgi:hypothetical protein
VSYEQCANYTEGDAEYFESFPNFCELSSDCDIGDVYPVISFSNRPNVSKDAQLLLRLTTTFHGF